ncbi:hypothetical protein O181_001208 [Austropuccinia psidii MF-1]|uniref:Uncharacterized protein n=1 Tax=Austropuccinia psidii MF-1 TaxID=1389203 RepID=A0A9Q3BA25_9BASI|nr:hypothetical protein [Austropuccinia psidii MF-1]
MAKEYVDKHFPNWESQLFLTKEKNFKSASGKITSVGTIIKEMIIPQIKGKIRLNKEFLVLEDAHIQGFLLGNDYQRMYLIDIYSCKSRNITIVTNKEKKFPLEIYQLTSQDPFKELLNEFKEGKLSSNLTSKQKLSLLKVLRKKRQALSIGEEPLSKIRGNCIKLYLDVERPY